MSEPKTVTTYEIHQLGTGYQIRQTTMSLYHDHESQFSCHETLKEAIEMLDTLRRE